MKQSEWFRHYANLMLPFPFAWLAVFWYSPLSLASVGFAATGVIARWMMIRLREQGR